MGTEVSEYYLQYKMSGLVEEPDHGSNMDNWKIQMEYGQVLATHQELRKSQRRFGNRHQFTASTG